MHDSITRQDPEVLLAYVVRTPDGRECTIAPRDATDDERTTQWITADERGFVALDEMR